MEAVMNSKMNIQEEKAVMPTRRVFNLGSIRVRLLIIFVLLVLLPAAIIGTASGVGSLQAGRQQVIHQLESVVSLKESQINDWLETLQLQIELIVDLDSEATLQDLGILLQGTPDAATYRAAYDTQLNRFQQVVGHDFEELFLINLQGEVILSTEAAQEGKDYSRQAFFQEGLKKDYIQPPFYSPSLDRTSLVIVHPLADEQGRTWGVLAGRASMAKLSEIMQERTGLGETGETYLVGANNALLTEARFTEDMRYVRTQGTDNAIKNRNNGSGLYGDYRGEPVVEVYHWLPELQVVLMAKQDQVEAFSTTYVTLGIIGGIALVALVIAVMIGLVMTRRITNPLTSLAKTSQQIAAGDLSARAPHVASGDEIGVLAASFNQMADQVSGLLDRVQARSQELEERTREMEASQRVTFAASERTTPDALLDLVVNLIRDQFHLYHVQMYMVDEEKQAAVLRKSTGFAGRRLLQSGHQIPLDRPSLVTQAIHEGQPTLVADVSQDANFMANPLLPHTQSELAVPLKLGEQVIGVLDAQDREADRFTESTITLFQTMTNQIAFLFENSDLLDNVAEQSEMLTIFASQLRTAADIARQLGTVLDPDRLLQQVVDMMQSRFGLYHAHIYVLETSPEGNGHGPAEARLTVRAGSGEVGQVLRERGHNIPLDSPKSPVARAARSREIVVVNNTDLVRDFMPNPLLPQTRSELAVPLVFGEQVLGVLDMQDDQPGRFTQTELDTFTTLAGQVATALQTAGLFAQVQARFLVGQALAGTQTEDDVLNAMVEVANAYPEARISIYTIDQDSSADNGQEMTAIMRRGESFESGILFDLPIEARFTDDQFKLLDRVSAGEPFISPNLLLDERADPLSRETAAQGGVVSMTLLPIMAGDEWLGLITASSQREGYFDERKLHLYRSLAEQGALALRTGQLFDETQQTAERLREVDRIKGEFLASMSHELRTPLNSILGYTEVMLLGLNGDLDPETQEDVQAIYDNGQHLLSLINDVLDVAKIEAGYLKLNIEEIQIETLIETAQNNAAGLLTNKPNVEFVIEAEGAEAFPSIQGDQIRLTQILNNLLSNAIKFTDEGKVTLRAYRDHPDWICLEVEDSGIGMKQEDLDKIFDRFHQVDSSESRRAGGTGLGLPITRHLIESHGGTIEVHSQLGQGSTFTVRLPVQVQEDQVEPEIEAENEA